MPLDYLYFDISSHPNAPIHMLGEKELPLPIALLHMLGRLVISRFEHDILFMVLIPAHCNYQLRLTAAVARSRDPMY